MIAALFVEPDGVYYGLPDVDPWDEERDARLYAGPWPVVAHPPCARWSRLAGFVEHVHGHTRGEDGGCFEAALRAVKKWGGVLEHPAYSRAWDAFGLPKPLVREGWTGGMCGGWSCYVEQGRYGELPVKKATWLYAFGVDLADLRWGFTPDRAGAPLPPGVHGMNHWRDLAYRPRARRGWRLNLPRDGDVSVINAADGRMRGPAASRTPVAFRDVLLAMARSANVQEQAA